MNLPEIRDQIAELECRLQKLHAKIDDIIVRHPFHGWTLRELSLMEMAKTHAGDHQ